MPDRLLEEGLGCGHIACPAQPEVDGLPGFVHGSIEVDPLAAYLDIGLIDSPRATTGSSKAVPAHDELQGISPNPAHDGLMGKTARLSLRSAIISTKSRKLSL
jgi:hypothetical protein